MTSDLQNWEMIIALGKESLLNLTSLNIHSISHLIHFVKAKQRALSFRRNFTSKDIRDCQVLMHQLEKEEETSHDTTRYLKENPSKIGDIIREIVYASTCYYNLRIMLEKDSTWLEEHSTKMKKYLFALKVAYSLMY